MKIGIYTPYLDTLTGGERYMLTIARCLSDKHEIEVFWDDITILQRADERFGLGLDKVRVVQNIFSPRTSFLKRLQISKHYDAIFFLSDGSIPVLASKKTILHFQFPVEWIPQKFITKAKMGRIHKVICNSQFTKEFIDRKFKIHSTIVYPPVSFWKETKTKKKNMILTVGRFSMLPTGRDFKKQTVLIECFKELVDDGLKGWELVIAGNSFAEDAKHVEAMKQQAKGYPIHIKHNISQKDMHELYDSAVIYWHAAGYGEELQSHPEYAEHFGISTVEAMGAGAVPVVINAGGQSEIVDEGINGLLWNTPGQLKTETMRLINDKKLREKLVSDRENLVAQYGEERFAREIKELI